MEISETLNEAIEKDTSTGDGRISEATAVARSCLSASSHAPQGAKRRSQGRSSGYIRTAQDIALGDWSRVNGLVIENDQFQINVDAQGDDDPSGGEQDVYYDQKAGRWWKRNILILHQLDHWHLGFLERLLLHNWLFPEVSYMLEGFTETPSGLLPIVSQPDVWALCGANRSETKDFMVSIGFEWAGANNFRSGELHVGDLHDENILITPAGNYAVIDPEIHLESDL